MTSPLDSMQVSTVDASSDPITVAALIGGVKWGGAPGTAASVSYSFGQLSSTWVGVGGSNYSALNEPDYWPASMISGLDEDARAAVQTAFSLWSSVAGLTLVEVPEITDSVGDVRFGVTEVPAITGWWGWAYLPAAGEPSGGDVWINPVALDGNWAAGSRGMFALIHELGHTLGLKHPHDGAYLLPSSLDSHQYTVMSYNRHPNSYLGTDAEGRDLFVEPSTPMVYDIGAIQRIYGANATHAAGNNRYVFDPAAKFIQTIWDTGGVDTLSAARFRIGCDINLEEGSYSSLRYAGYTPQYGPGGTFGYDGTDNLGLAFGTAIENALGGAGDDRLHGNTLNNLLRGGAGDDTILGGEGADTASYGNASSAVTISLAIGSPQTTGGAGLDTLVGIERLIGSRFDDRLTGNDEANILNGYGGADTLTGGSGNDTYIVDNAGDTVVESTSASSGEADQVILRVADYTMPDGVEKLRIAAPGGSQVAGNTLDNLIVAGSGDDVINAGDGVDMLSYVHAGGGVVVNLGLSGPQLTVHAGTDRVLMFENLHGSHFDDQLDGDDNANRIAGDAGNDSLRGAGGNDSLRGGQGSDTLWGGSGNDTLWGGYGSDMLYGDAGADQFSFDRLSQMGLPSGAHDIIADFVVGQDRLDLRGIDADATISGDQAFLLLTDAVSGFSAPGQLRFVDGVLLGNVNSDFSADFAVTLIGVIALDAADILA